MAIARLGSIAVTNGTSAGQNTSGATLFVAINGSNAATAPTDSQGNTWVKVNEKTGGGFGGTYAMWYVNNPSTAGSGHTFSGGGTLNGLCVAWYSGTDTAGPLDQQCSALSGGSSPVSCASALTPAVAASLIIAGTGGPIDAGTINISAGLTIRQTINGAGGVSYGAILADLESQTAAIQPAWDDAIHDVGLILLGIFKPSTGGGGGGKPFKYYQSMQLANYRREQQQREHLIERTRETILRRAA